ncbi:hypothetical protein ACQBAU_11130 [Propionibacteriaceae bacterium Y2011]|uniref:hypothetical protein n=1 Tax=Microlunatus sp. Y2014 TaxID=3418488 RepID=UPI003B4EE865
MSEQQPTDRAHLDGVDDQEPGWSATGHPAVDATLASVADLDRVPLADHAERLAAAHEQLHATLDEHRTRPDPA